MRAVTVSKVHFIQVVILKGLAGSRLNIMPGLLEISNLQKINVHRGFPWWLSSKEYVCQCLGEVGLIPRSGRFLGERNRSLLQYPCLGNPMEKGACQATVYQVTMSWT